MRLQSCERPAQSFKFVDSENQHSEAKQWAVETESHKSFLPVRNNQPYNVITMHNWCDMSLQRKHASWNYSLVRFYL